MSTNRIFRCLSLLPECSGLLVHHENEKQCIRCYACGPILSSRIRLAYIAFAIFDVPQYVPVDQTK